MSAWAARYEELALTGVRSREVTDRIALHLGRFGEYLSATYGHDRLATVVRRDVVGWRDMLVSSGPRRLPDAAVESLLGVQDRWSDRLWDVLDERGIDTDPYLARVAA